MRLGMGIVLELLERLSLKSFVEAYHRDFVA
jgi:hypothetical protein